MNLVDRARNILLQPKAEWAVIEAEPATVRDLFTGYAMILALLPLIGSLIGGILLGSMMGRVGVGLGIGFFLVSALISYAISLGILWLMIVVIEALLPSFDGEKDRVRAAKLAVYAATPTWVIGFFAFIPGINVLLMLIGFVYGAYLLYIGSGVVTKVPVAKAAGFTIVTIVIWIVVTGVVSAVIAGTLMAALFSSAVVGLGTLPRL